MFAYKKLRVVGRGAHGLVTLCERISDGNNVVLKEVTMEHLSLDEKVGAMNEVKVLSKLNHSNVITYYDRFIHNSSLMIVMEYATRGSLHDLLIERSGCLIEQEDIVLWFAQIVLGLNHIHAHKILHRDLKTTNILVCGIKGMSAMPILKIGDFGISKALASQSKANTVLGTPSYLSPELCQGQAYDEHSDMWALGCVLYEMLTLKKAFEAPTLAALVMKIMCGHVEPIDQHKYSLFMQQLLSELLEANAPLRPTTAALLAHPILAPAICRVCTELGRIQSTHPQ